MLVTVRHIALFWNAACRGRIESAAPSFFPDTVCLSQELARFAAHFPASVESRAFPNFDRKYRVKLNKKSVYEIAGSRFPTCLRQVAAWNYNLSFTGDRGCWPVCYWLRCLLFGYRLLREHLFLTPIHAGRRRHRTLRLAATAIQLRLLGAWFPTGRASPVPMRRRTARPAI
jgi:hypothetical protein